MPTPDTQLEARITAALDAPPQIRIPAGFAARVAAQAPARPALRLTRTPRIGRATLFAAMAVLATLMLCLLPLTGTLTPRLLEYLFTAEFLILVLYTTLRPDALR